MPPFFTTRREAPAGLDLPGQQWLVRAGYIQLLPGGAALLPLGEKTLDRLAAAIRPPDALEVALPPGMSALSALAETARAHLRSHRQLPAVFARRAWLDGGARRGAGLIGARWSDSLELACLDATPEALDAALAGHAADALSLFARCGLPICGAEDEPDAGASDAHAWWFAHPAGEDLLTCEECGYAAFAPAARRAYVPPRGPVEAALPLEEIATPGVSTIAALTEFLKIPAARTAKAVFLTAAFAGGREETVFCVVRGDREVNETALRRVLGALSLRPASDEAVRALGAVPGYASPVGLRGARILVDEEIPASPNLVAGANRAGTHLLNTNFARDYPAAQVAAIARGAEGEACPECRAPLQAARGVRLAQAMHFDPAASFVDAQGKLRPACAALLRMDLGRLLGCLAEQARDERGLTLPLAAAPYPVHLTVLGGKLPELEQTAAGARERLATAGLEPWVDDRAESPGVKFADADLIGLPLRVTVSERALRAGGVELKLRTAAQAESCPLDELGERARRLLDAD